MTPQYVLHTLMHCTYYTVSLTCTVHVLYTVSRDVLQGVGMTSDDCCSCFDSIQATTFRLMNEVELAQLSNRVVAVMDEELLLVDMQPFVDVGAIRLASDVQALTYVPSCVKTGWSTVEYREFSIPGGWSNCNEV